MPIDRCAADLSWISNAAKEILRIVQAHIVAKSPAITRYYGRMGHCGKASPGGALLLIYGMEPNPAKMGCSEGRLGTAPRTQ